ncbi:Aste57867_24764 [Aphanomyces stellatus]|uniref:Aste57867_24764 protein n=1 Tax=Aphanomyces stellatus TaxID=120398 RepID=A0A485LSA8_9STRA|nr:hypothetical protein As57867_024686 [Aphanomyces stellatus]VFU01400.1 Aste57867_24764 [Aphanomyces stellatus]
MDDNRPVWFVLLGTTRVKRTRKRQHALLTSHPTNADKLASFDASELKVYANVDELHKVHPVQLDGRYRIGSEFGKDDVLVVVVPSFALVVIPGGQKEVLNKLENIELDSRDRLSQTPLEAFWESLPTLVPENGILKFASVPPFFPNNMNFLLIRASYQSMFEKIKSNLENPDVMRRYNRMAITGNPGIGKSLFLFYVMWRISSMRGIRTVILHRQKDRGLIYVFEKSEKTRCWTTRDLGQIDKFLFRRDTWYLTDTLNPPPGEVAAMTILVASPARKHYKEFLKYSSTDELRYLPVWSLDELKQVADLYKATAEDVQRRYCLIGGIPRYVLEKAGHDLTEVIDSAVSRLNIEKFNLIASGALDKEDEISHIIFSSLYVTEKALDLFSNSQRNKLCEFLLNNDPASITAGLRGNLFEAYSHRVLSAGGTFAYRNLEDGTTGSFTLPQRQSDRFSDISECQSKKYFIPWNPNYRCVDSYIPGEYLFQMTVSDQHPIDKAKMEAISRAAKLSSLYFVVPQSSYMDFKPQRLDEKDKKRQGKIRKVVKKLLAQYVVGIEIA